MIGINTNSLKNLSLYDALFFIVNTLACKNIEVTTDGRAHAYKYLIDEPCSFFSVPGVNYIALGGGWVDFAASDCDLVAKQVALCHDILGVKKIRFFASNPHNEVEDLKTAVTNLKIYADKYPSIIFMIENHGGITSSAIFTRELLRRVNRPNVKLVFDPANFIASKENPITALYWLYPYIEHVHVKDINGEGFCAVGEGVTPWLAIVYRLNKLGYNKYFSIEYEGVGDRCEGLTKSLNNFKEIYSMFYKQK